MLPKSDLHLRFHAPPRSVCLLRLSAIGDVCNAVPLVRNLQSAWPGTAITWMIGAAEFSLIGDIPRIEFLRYDKRNRLLEGRRPAAALAGRQFDLLLNLQASWRANLLARRVSAPVKLGFDFRRARDMQWLFSTHRISPTPRLHVAEAFLTFGDALGVARGPLRWDIPLPEAERAFAREKIPEGRATLLLSPCSSQRARNFRNWPAERYAQVVRTARERFGLHTIITGGGTALEREYAERIVELAGAQEVTNVVGRTSLKQLLALIDRALCVLAPDSGPVHMATTVGTPALGLYATSNPMRTGPLDPRWTVSRYEQALQRFLDTSSTRVRWGRRVRDADAMSLIEVEDVLAMLRRLLDTPPAQRRPPWL